MINLCVTDLHISVTQEHSKSVAVPEVPGIKHGTSPLQDRSLGINMTQK